MRLSRLPEPLPRDACQKTGVLRPHPSRGRDFSTRPCAPTRVEDPQGRSADAALRRREKYAAAVVLAAAITAALAGTAWAGGLTGDASHGEALYEACQDCHSLDKNDV